MDTQFKLGDGRQVNFEKSAKVVKYNGGNLKDALDKLTTVTEYGGKLSQAENLRELRHDLRVEVPEIYEESGYSYWEKVGEPTFTATHAKFGGKCAYVAPDNNIATAEPVTFGGDPFTFQFWMYYTQPFETKVLMNFGDFRVATYQERAGEYQYAGLIIANSSNAKLAWFVQTYAARINNADSYQNKVVHFEIGYSGGTMYLFANGTRQGTLARTITRLPRNIKFGGGQACYIDEFRILDGVCVHTANFTPPTAQYNVTDKTVALLHFD